MSGLTKEAVSAAFIRGYQAALCNSDVPGWSLRQEADKAADEAMALVPKGYLQFCSVTKYCRMADGHEGVCKP
jgi:hypothetical protein